MSYMGYYFLPDAIESINETPNGKKKRGGRRTKVLSIVALVTVLVVLILFIVL